MLDMGCHTIEAARYFIGKENKIVEVLAWTDRLVHHDRDRCRRQRRAADAIRQRRAGPGGIELDGPRRPGSAQRNLRHRRRDLHRRHARDADQVFSRAGAGYTVEKAEAETGWLFPPVDEAWTYGYREEMRHFIECVGNHREPRETFADG